MRLVEREKALTSILLNIFKEKNRVSCDFRQASKRVAISSRVTSPLTMFLREDIRYVILRSDISSSRVPGVLY